MYSVEYYNFKTVLISTLGPLEKYRVFLSFYIFTRKYNILEKNGKLFLT